MQWLKIKHQKGLMFPFCILWEKHGCNGYTTILLSPANNAMSHGSVITCVIALLAEDNKIMLSQFHGSLFCILYIESRFWPKGYLMYRIVWWRTNFNGQIWPNGYISGAQLALLYVLLSKFVSLVFNHCQVTLCYAMSMFC